MPRGSRPGERRGGRKKGTSNKRTLWSNIVASDLATAPHLTPVDLFLGLMRSPQLPLDLRIDMAQLALPFLHAKPRTAPRMPAAQLTNSESRPRVKLRVKTEGPPDEDVEIDDEWLGIGCDGAASQTFDVPSLVTIVASKAACLQAEGQVEVVQNTLECKTQTLPLGSDHPLIGRPEITAPSARGATTTAVKKIGPLAFLRTVLHHPRTPLNQRLKVASILAPYLHPKPIAAPPNERSFEVEDEYGFSVDPQLAKRLRDLARQRGLPHLASARPRHRIGGPGGLDATDENRDATFAKKDEAKLAEELEAKFAAEKKALRCSPSYRGEDAKRDWERLRELGDIRNTRVLTPEEDFEETHLTARALSYENSAEYADRKALEDERRALREARNKLYKKWKDYSINETEQQEFDRLRAILNEIDADSVHPNSRDPVYSDFRHQLAMEAKIRGRPEPRPEEIRQQLAEMESSADIIRRSFPPLPKQAPAGPQDVDLAAWLRGEVSYPPWLLSKAVPAEYRNLPIELMMIGLVRNEKLVSELELSPYFSWILYIYNRELKRGNNPAENMTVETEAAIESLRSLARSLRSAGPFPLRT
jgi:hypothetical protein